MGRRTRNDEIAFGSDSFLDIVANIVGILIILMVIAGVRVSQMPAPSDEPQAPSSGQQQHVATDVPEPPRVIQRPRSLPRKLPAARQAPPPPPTAVSPPPPLSPPPELVGQIAAVSQEIERLSSAAASLTSTLSQKVADAQSVRQRISVSSAALTREHEVLDQGRQTVAALQSGLEADQRAIAGLHLEQAEVEASQPAPQILRHKLTPIGKVVDGEELHFLLAEGRVAVVPVDKLAEELKGEILRKKTQLLRGQTRIGTVGPVQGFTMEYVVEREAVSLREELQSGVAVVRIGVSEWRILPQPTAVFETADEALQPRSRFLTALRAAGAHAALTYWVYPDSFSLHRELQDFAHLNGFDVAARPLPFGIPITGSSTRGSRSVAQ